MSSTAKRAGGGKAAKHAPPEEPQFFRGVVMLLGAPSAKLALGGPGVRLLAAKVAAKGGVAAMDMKELAKVGAAPTHCVVANGVFAETAEEERKALGAPASARLVTCQWVHDSLSMHLGTSALTTPPLALKDVAPYEPRPRPTTALAAVQRRRSPSPDEEDDFGGAGPGAHGGAAEGPPFQPPPASGAVCALQRGEAHAGCGRALGWSELGPLCQACLRDKRATPYVQCLHMRFLVDHPNKALVAALQELADYRELFGTSDDFRSAESIRRAAAVLKATPRDVHSTAELDALKLPFIAQKLRDEYLKPFWETGKVPKLDAERRLPGRVEARQLARLPYVGGQAAKRWVDAGLDTAAKVLAAEKAGALQPRIANEYARTALKHADELLKDIRTEDHAPLIAAITAAVNKAVPRSSDDATSQPEITLVGGSRRGKHASHDLDILVVLPRDGTHAGTLMRTLRALAQDEAIVRLPNGNANLIAGLAVDASVTRVAGEPDDADADTDDEDAAVADSPRKTSHVKTGGGKPGGGGASSRMRDPRLLMLWRAGDDGIKEKEHDLSAANKALILIEMNGLPLRHVDLLVVPYHQRAFWLLGWTGSRELERLLRHYVKEELAAVLSQATGVAVPTLKLTNTVLVTSDDGKRSAPDKKIVTKSGELVPVAQLQPRYIDARAYPETEQELFDLLRLPYRDASERNA